jgi:pilus assembly protein Flp/PilA
LAGIGVSSQTVNAPSLSQKLDAPVLRWIGPMPQLLRRFIRDETGATAIEYGMIAALIAVAIIASLRLVGGRLGTKFTAISNNLN